MSRISRRASVIINLLKIQEGYMVENDQRSTTIQIPKQYINQPKQRIQNQDSSQEFQSNKKKVKTEKLEQLQVDNVQVVAFQQYLNTSSKQMNCQPKVAIPPPEILPYQMPPPEQIAKQRQPQKYALIIPSCSAWFSLENVNLIEKNALNEYFSGNKISKTPEIYKRYRNFIIQLYRSNPQVYLTATTCRRALSGDACGISRIHKFLEHWGIINFNVDPETYPDKLLPYPSTHFDNLSKQSDELEEFSDLTSSEKLMINSLKILSKNYRPLCDFCGIICGLVWFQQKQLTAQREICLCFKCYTNQNFPSILHQDDFVKIHIESQFEKTDILQKIQKGEVLNISELLNETLFLLSLIEDFPQMKWDGLCEKMNETFATKRSQEELVLHYLQLPFKNIESLQKCFDSQSDEPLKASEIMQRLAIQEPQLYSDHSNALNFHVGLLKTLMHRHSPKQINESAQIVITQEEFKQNVNNSKMLEEVGEQSYEVKELQDKNDQESQNALNILGHMSENEAESVIAIQSETSQRARILQKNEQKKLNELMNLMISIQMEKLELKLGYLEEYEKLILYEKKHLEIQQKMCLGDRLQIIQQRLQN